MSKRNYNTTSMIKARIEAVKKQTASYQAKLALLDELQAACDENFKVRDAIMEHPQKTGDAWF
jgi:hypothetical protein